VENAWLKVVEGIGTGQGTQGVVLLPPGVIILLLDVGQLLSQVPNSVMCALEALHFRVEGFIPLLVDSEVNH
jgi:hypothetical protein